MSTAHPVPIWPAPLGAAVLAAGQALGVALGEVPWVEVVLGLGLAAAPVWLVARRGCRRRGAVLCLLGVAALVAGLRASLAAAALAPAPAAQVAREGPLEGTFWAGPGRRPGVGRLATANGVLPWRLVLEGPIPADGARVRLLGPLDPRPFAAGPVPGPARREGRFLGELPLLADQVVVLDSPAGGPLQEGPLADGVGRLRRYLGAAVAQSLPSAPGLGPALLVGDRDGIPPELSELFRRTGLSHLLALSGMHVAVVAVVLLVPLSRLAAALGGRAAELVVRLALLGAFALLVGLEAPIARAALVLGLAWVVPYWAAGGAGLARGGVPGRRVHGLSLWGVALCVELLRSPLGLFDVGTQLSYGAALAILMASRPLAGWGRAEDQIGRHLRWTRSAPRIAAGLLGAAALRWTRLAASVSLAATLTSAPLLWIHFGEFCPWSVPASALAGPLLLPLLGGLWGEALLGPGPWGEVADGAARALVELLDAVDHLPATPWVAPERPALLLLGAGAALLLSVALRGRRWARPLAAAGLFVCAVVLVPWRVGPARLEVTCLDVGHGTAALVRAPGLPLIVFDAGSRDRPGLVREALLPWVARFEPARTWVVLSHADRDHWQALPWVAERLAPERWIGPRPADVGVRLPRGTHPEDLGPGRLDLVAEGSGPVVASVLRGLQREDNEGSRHLFVRQGNQGVLLLGDAVGPGLFALLDRQLVPGGVDLLLAPHHGSFGPATAPLLRRGRARRLWVSVDREPPLAEEWERRGLPWAWTGRDGPLVWRSAPTFPGDTGTVEPPPH
ncbi:MAG: MBL fold metallo-hydrolase [Planctomycetaceae bacterium]|nr:MBL fold metallo-hydrolase [Planctomycetaceae bacterium]